MSTPMLDPRRWWALALLAVAQFIVILDTSIVAIALPTIQRDLAISVADLQWVFNAYVVAFGGLLLLGGRLADLFGRRRLFMLGFAILTLSSLLAGFAPTSEILFAGRALMGLGAALVAPAALSLVISLFSANPPELAKALGLFGAAAPAGGTAGVFLGGVITEWLTWRWTFLINVPLGLLVLAASLLLLRPGRVQQGHIDGLGALAITGALVLTVYAIVTGNAAGWSSLQTLGLFAVAALLLAGFVVVQVQRQEPLVPLTIFRAPNLAAGNLVMALLGAAWIPLWFFLNLYLQQVLGYGAFQSGLALVPMTIAIMALMVGVTARMIGRYGVKPNLIAGLVLLTAALMLFAQTPPAGDFLIHVLPASLLAALGMALSYIPAMIAATAGARPEEMGLASGLVNTTYQIGSALGLAAMTALATATTQLGTGTPDLVALNSGFHAAFVGAASIAAAGALAAFAWLRQPGAQAAAIEQPQEEALLKRAS